MNKILAGEVVHSMENLPRKIQQQFWYVGVSASSHGIASIGQVVS